MASFVGRLRFVRTRTRGRYRGPFVMERQAGLTGDMIAGRALTLWVAGVLVAAALLAVLVVQAQPGGGRDGGPGNLDEEDLTELCSEEGASAHYAEALR